MFYFSSYRGQKFYEYMYLRRVENNNKFGFPPILKACTYQILDPYTLKTKHLRKERDIISGYFEDEE